MIEFNNKSFNELVDYIDHDLLDVLTDEQRDHIYTLAATSIALQERHDTTAERADLVLAGATMKNYRNKENKKNLTGWKMAKMTILVSITIAGILAAIILF